MNVNVQPTIGNEDLRKKEDYNSRGGPEGLLEMANSIGVFRTS